MYRIAISASAAVLLLTATDALATPDQVAQLKSGDISICADKDISAAIAVIVQPEAYDRFVKNGNELPALWAVSATSVNKDIGEISCEATFPPTGPIQFTVRPSLDEPGGLIIDVAHTPGSERMARWIAERALKNHNER
jgi:hypothetical protein